MRLVAVVVYILTIGNYRIIPEVQERLVITLLDRGQTPQQTLRMQRDSMYYATHCATCAKTLVINVTCRQASSRKWMPKNSYIVTRRRSTRTRLALEHASGGVSVPSSQPVFTIFCKQRRRMLKFQNDYSYDNRCKS